MNSLVLTIKMACTNLLGNKLRSFLTMLGIVVGIAAVISILSLGAGAQSLITSALKNLGTDTLTVLPGNSEENGPPAQALGISIQTLTEEDAEAIKELSFVEALTGFNNGNEEMVYLSRYVNASYSGVNASYTTVANHKVALGRFFNIQEERSQKNVVVLGADLKETLFPLTNPVNQHLKIGKESFLVIGVMERKGSTLFESLDNRAFMPLKVAQNKMTGEKHLDSIRIKVENENQIEAAQKAITDLLRYRHEIKEEGEEDFSVRSVTSALELFTGISQALSFFLAIIAAVSLLIGGISVMNIMLMTVKERTKEIGLRKAIGATATEIETQFLIETIVMTTLGGFIGIALGTGFSFSVYAFMQILDYDWSFQISLFSIVISCTVSTIIGIIFGVYPARKAAALNPIEALRYE